MLARFIPMSKMAAGEAGRIREIRATGGIRRRLFELGMIEGTRVECLFKAAHGDPAAFGIRGTVIALRKEDLETIFVNIC